MKTAGGSRMKIATAQASGRSNARERCARSRSQRMHSASAPGGSAGNALRPAPQSAQVIVTDVVSRTSATKVAAVARRVPDELNRRSAREE